jgi:hypothetical protein
VIVRFVDIGGIVDHHCLSFLFITSIIKILSVMGELYEYEMIGTS